MATIPSIAMIPSGVKAGKLYSVLPTNGTGDFTTTRASVATRVNQSGLIEEVAANVPRLDYTGGGCPSLLLEPQQTQLYGETATMATQTKTVTAVEHTVGFYGTGTITFTGVYSGSLVGTGTNDRVELTFTPTAGSLISTVSGSVTSSQLVTGAYLGSYIPNTTTGTITRIADTASGSGNSTVINSTEGTLYAEISALVNDSSFREITISDGSNNNRIELRYGNGSNKIEIVVRSINGTVETIMSTISYDVTNFNKVAVRYKLNDVSLWVNGVKINTDTVASMPINLSELAFDSGAGSNDFYGKTKSVQVYTTALSDAELISLTTI